MTTRNDKETTMKRTPRTLSLVLALGVALGAMVFASTASARIPVEPGYGSPVTYNHPRKPEVKKVVRRNWGGYPLNGHTHVRSIFAPDDQ